MTLTETTVYGPGLRQGDQLADGATIDAVLGSTSWGYLDVEVVTAAGDRERRSYPLGRRYRVYRRYSGDVW